MYVTSLGTRQYRFQCVKKIDVRNVFRRTPISISVCVVVYMYMYVSILSNSSNSMVINWSSTGHTPPITTRELYCSLRCPPSNYYEDEGRLHQRAPGARLTKTGTKTNKTDPQLLHRWGNGLWNDGMIE